MGEAEGNRRPLEPWRLEAIARAATRVYVFSLPPADRQLIVMAKVDRLTDAEIAAVLRIPVNGVSVRRREIAIGLQEAVRAAQEGAAV